MTKGYDEEAQEDNQHQRKKEIDPIFRFHPRRSNKGVKRPRGAQP